MLKYCPFIFAIFSTLSLTAQKVQWASKILEFSSQRRAVDIKQFAAIQVLGEPDVFPKQEMNPCAWAPQVQNNASVQEFIWVGFDEPMSVAQIVVAENFGAGALSQIYAYDQANQPYMVYKNPNPGPLPQNGRLNSIIIPKTSYKVVSLKVMLNTSKVKGYNQIDAIGISDSEQPIEIPINEAPKLGVTAQKEHLGAEINSAYQEISPNISSDGKILYFTRADHPGNIPDTLGGKKVYKQDVWAAEILSNEKFSSPKNLGPPINNRQHNSSFTIFDNGKAMLLNNRYRPDGLLEVGFSITRKEGESWGKPKPLNIEGYNTIIKIDTADFYSDACISQNGRVLIMAIRTKESLGDKDLYVSFKINDTTYSKPQSLGKAVNSAGSESAPFLAADEKTLYFASNGFRGYGKLDIYVTRRLDNSWLKWSVPENVGREINSRDSELYFTIPQDARYAYFTSNKDIYRIPLPEPIKPNPVAKLQGNILDKSNKQNIPGKIIIEIVTAQKMSTDTVLQSSDGKYASTVDIGKKYRLTAEAPGYFPLTQEANLEQIKDFTEITKDFELVPLRKGEKVKLENIYFARAQANLLPESYPSLDELVKTMQENPNVRILLEGHTEIFGNRKSLTKLSLRRVESVKNYLIQKGVNEKRIELKGYGPSMPLSNADTEEARQLNRRVEVKIL